MNASDSLRRFAIAGVALLVLLTAAACGKKGPPERPQGGEARPESMEEDDSGTIFNY